MKTPKVTVLMPVYNGEKYLKEAINSILKQKYRGYEFIIINDGSTDNSVKIISSYSDSRIRFIDNKKNFGLVSSLNEGLELANGEYIARMDCDDISVEDRLEVQVKFMDKHISIGACGSYYYLMREKKKAIADFPLNEKEIKCFLLFNSPIAHPTSFIRMGVIKENNLRYSSEFIHAEDYDLWSRMAGYAGLANIPKPLLFYRVHDSQMTGDEKVSKEKQKSVGVIRSRHIQQLGINASNEELTIHNIVSDGLTPETEQEISSAEQWLKKLITISDQKDLLDKNYFQKIIFERWFRLCFNSFRGKAALSFFLQSEIYSMIKLPVKRKLELAQSFYYSWKRLRIKS